MPENLVIGASGQVGEHLLAALRQSGRSALGTYHQHQTDGLVSLDLRDSRQTADLIQQSAPQTIYLPGALTNVDYCETHPEDSRAINVTALQGVVHAANAIGAQVVYFSSDYIFDGRSGAYTEDQPANPICEYGRHKLAAEHYISLNAAKFLIIRTTVVFGWEAQGKNFVSRLIRTLGEKQRMRVPTDQVGSPTYAPDLGSAVVELAGRGAQGVFNVVGRERASRFDFARAAARIFDLDETLIEPVSTDQLVQIAPRPLDAGLMVEKVEQVLGRSMMDYQAGLRDMLSMRGTHHVA